jgi:hypothetical protein
MFEDGPAIAGDTFEGNRGCKVVIAQWATGTLHAGTTADAIGTTSAPASVSVQMR